jgi:GTPase SAR1 family protein
VVDIVIVHADDMTLEEASEVNRMAESLKLFSEITRNRAFEQTQFVLFLNKYDLFKEKVETRRIPLQTLFEDYEGAQTAEEAAKFIQAKYEKNYGAKRPLVIHTTCVLDKSVCLNVFGSIRDDVLRPLLDLPASLEKPN